MILCTWSTAHSIDRKIECCVSFGIYGCVQRKESCETDVKMSIWIDANISGDGWCVEMTVCCFFVGMSDRFHIVSICAQFVLKFIDCMNMKLSNKFWHDNCFVCPLSFEWNAHFVKRFQFTYCTNEFMNTLTDRRAIIIIPFHKLKF